MGIQFLNYVKDPVERRWRKKLEFADNCISVGNIILIMCGVPTLIIFLVVTALQANSFFESVLAFSLVLTPAIISYLIGYNIIWRAPKEWVERYSHETGVGGICIFGLGVLVVVSLWVMTTDLYVLGIAMFLGLVSGGAPILYAMINSRR